MNKIGIINTGIENAISVKNWLLYNNVSADIISSQNVSSLAVYDIVILAGACNSGALSSNLFEGGYDHYIKKHVASCGKLIGICAGMHVLFEKIEEGNQLGLSILSGSVERLPFTNNGWHNLGLARKTMIEGWRGNRKQKISGRMFFNHQYYVACDENIKFHQIEINGFKLPNIVCKDNVIGIQGHPEKSQHFGSKLLSFLGIDK